MQPLKFRASPESPIEADAIELLGSISRHQPPPGQKQRVRQRILEHAVRRPISALRPVFVAGLVLIATAASAMLASHWFSTTQMRRQSSPSMDQQPQVSSLTGQVRGLSGVADDYPDMSLGRANAEVLPDANAALLRPNGIETPLHVEPTVRPASQASEKVLVFDAMRALRREGHPEQAAKLLDEYLRGYPQGSLAEEALALYVEASTSLRDPKAKNLADRYLVLYPNGRFRAAAERARARFAP
jgi:hypothetical protein